MVLPLLLRGIAFLAPKIIPVISKIAQTAGRFLLPKTFKGALIGAATIPATVGLATTPFGKKALKTVFDPRKGFERGKATPEFVTEVVTKIKEPTTKVSEFDITEALKKAGLIGAGAALVGGTIVAGKRVRERFARQEMIAQLPLAPTPVTGRALAPVRQPVEEKPVVVEALPKVKPITIRNVFKPSIDISFRKSRRFINQQVLIK